MATSPHVNVTYEVDALTFAAGVDSFSPAMIESIRRKLERVTGPRWEKMVRRLTRRRTGRMRKTAMNEVVAVGEPYPSVVLRVGYDVRELMRLQAGVVKRPVPYADWVEYGTERRAGDHVLRRTLTRQRPRITRDVQEAVDEAAEGVFGR